MAQDYDLSQKQPSDEKADDPIVSEMEKMNFNLSEISSSLAFFKWLVIISIALSILLGIIAFAYFAKRI